VPNPVNHPVNNNTSQCNINPSLTQTTTPLNNNTIPPQQEHMPRPKCHSSPLDRHPPDTGESNNTNTQKDKENTVGNPGGTNGVTRILKIYNGKLLLQPFIQTEFDHHIKYRKIL
jgi:hypothetical protein